MKLGYSLLLGELIDGAEVGYDDCRRFQIVCPCCKEPVFKVERTPELNPIHYLSHYERGRAYEEDCGLRVSSIPKEEIDQRNEEARNQKLSLFLRVLQDAIITTNVPNPSGRKHARQGIHELSLSKSLRAFREGFLQDLKDREVASSGRLVDEVIEMRVQLYRAELPSSPLAMSINRRIVKDIWSHLLTEKASRNFAFLFHEAWMCCHSRMLFGKETSPSRWGKADQGMLQFVRLLPRVSVEKGKELWEELSTWRVEEVTRTAAELLMYDLLGEMVGTLLRIPYLDLLRTPGRVVR